jgi:hypothetical protein
MSFRCWKGCPLRVRVGFSLAYCGRKLLQLFFDSGDEVSNALPQIVFCRCRLF